MSKKDTSAGPTNSRHWLFKHFNQYGDDIDIDCNDGIISARCACAIAKFTPIKTRATFCRVGPGRVLNPNITPFPIKTALITAAQKGAEFFHDPKSGQKGIRHKDECFSIEIRTNPGHENTHKHYEVDPLFGYDQHELAAVNGG